MTNQNSIEIPIELLYPGNGKTASEFRDHLVAAKKLHPDVDLIEIEIDGEPALSWSLKPAEMFAGLDVEWPGSSDVDWGAVAPIGGDDDRVRKLLYDQASRTYLAVREKALRGEFDV